MMFAKIDNWLARAVFWPIIIKICQETGCSKFAFGRVCSFTWACLFAYSWRGSFGWVFFLIIAPVLVIETLSLGLAKDSPYWPSAWLRGLWVAILLFNCVAIALRWAEWEKLQDLLMVFWAYAATLPHVPPKDKKERRLVPAKVRS